MAWADAYIAELQQNRAVSFRPRGNSMSGKINSGDLVEVIPVTELKKGDIVLCRVNGAHYLHFISAVRKGQFQISNNHGHINGCTTKDKIYGIVKSVSK